jgi:hypothetical protein
MASLVASRLIVPAARIGECGTLACAQILLAAIIRVVGRLKVAQSYAGLNPLNN